MILKLTKRELFKGVTTLAGLGALGGCVRPNFSLGDEVKNDLQNSDGVTTTGFTKLERQFPWLKTMRGNVGCLYIYFECAALRNYPFHEKYPSPIGSAVLLDEDGTLLLARHQVKVIQEILPTWIDMLKSSYPDIAAKIGIVFPAGGGLLPDVTFDSFDKTQDIGFATMNSSVLAKARQYGIQPVLLNSNKPPQKDDPILIVGYPFEDKYNPGNVWPILQATVGKMDQGIYSLVPSFIGECLSTTTAVSLKGNSGGGVFVNGEFIGTEVLGTTVVVAQLTGPAAYFVPWSYSRKAYQARFPERAKKLGIIQPESSAEPENRMCRFSPSSLQPL